MMLGHVRDNFAYITLPLPTLSGAVNIEFVIDTGFDGHLSLPPHIVRQLDAVYVLNRTVRNADGVESEKRMHRLQIEWSGKRRPVYVLELDNDSPLLGVELLAGHNVALEMTDGGEVTIEPLA
jgi:clan AA aspartic protease